MARGFEVELELTGLKLRLRGSREDIPVMTQGIGQQLAGLLQPAADIVEGEIVTGNGALPAQAEPAKATPRRRSYTRRRAQAGSPAAPANGGKNETLDWVHDPTKWGNPQQEWVTSQKATWLLYVVAHEKGTPGMSSKLIADTFNKHFFRAGRIQASKVSRDLGRLKSQKPAQVGEDTTANPPRWFLVNAGEEEARKLVQEALGSPGNTSD
jgi:hypothetical protein